MPVYPVTWHPPALTGDYPHLQRRDAALWEKFLAREAEHFQRVAYDVALGGIEPTDPEATEAERRGWQYTTAVKVDVLADRGDELWLIEVRPNAGVSAIGAVLAYLVLLEREPVSPLPVVPVILTDNLTADMSYVTDQLNIQVVLV